MRVMVTGHHGRLGSAVTTALVEDGHDVVGYDREAGQELSDLDDLVQVARGASVIVHCAGLADDRGGDAHVVMEANVLGTLQVLRAAEAVGAARVVYLSSGKALGMVAHPPSVLPLDDTPRRAPFRGYALSKWLAEEMCEAFTRDTAIATLCLRPVAVLCSPEDYARYAAAQATAEGWHLGAFIDLADVVSAVQAAVTCPDPGHVRLLLCADDIAGEDPTARFVEQWLSAVPWHGRRPRGTERVPLVDTTTARRVLEWEPRIRWSVGAAGHGHAAPS